jgi:ubiquinone/menaquinone biosynthesis C-methylase UbiE
MVEVDKKLKKLYDGHYSDNTEEWRKISAFGKVMNITEITKGIDFKNLIDIGAGDGNILSLLSENKFCEDLTAVEISESAIEQIKKKKIAGLSRIVQFDGYILPFKDKEFDLAICSHVIEHVEFPRTLLREIKRISKNQILEVPIDFSFKVDKKFKHFYEYGHINIFTPALFNFLLLTEGFEVLKSKSALYRKEAIDFQSKGNSIKYFKIMLKRLIWNCVPILMKIKPNTYTVLTR